jgi:hypothetical protein
MIDLHGMMNNMQSEADESEGTPRKPGYEPPYESDASHSRHDRKRRFAGKDVLSLNSYSSHDS